MRPLPPFSGVLQPRQDLGPEALVLLRSQHELILGLWEARDSQGLGF